jgi:TrmH family RNA methyltransferase
MGAVFTVGLAQARWDDFIGWLRAGEGQLVAASLRDAVPYRGAPYAAPCFILVGNESQGLPEDYELACDLRVTMPMKGRADSLNAAVAGAVLAYEVLASVTPG